GDNKLDITRLRATSGQAIAELRGQLHRAGRGDWRLESAGSLVDFDPVPWWPGEAGSAWRQGPHRLSAGWQLDLRLPGNAATLQPVELLQRLSGNGTLRVHDSVLAGVPLSADIKLGYTQAAAPTAVLLHAEALLGGNQIMVDGRGNPTGDGQGDRWRVEVKANALAALAPLSRLHPALADWVPRQGSASAVLAADGRWPAMRTEGSARVQQLQVSQLTLAQGQADWRMDSAGDRALSMNLALGGLQWGDQRADHLNAVLSGTLAEHRIDIKGAMPVRAPEAAVKLMGVQNESGTRGQLLAQGTWLADPAGGGRWRARVERLVVGSWDGSVGNAAPASVWAQARDLRAELQFGADGQLLALQADAGRVQLANDVALRWDAVKGDWRGSRPQFELRADVEPFALAPLLARLQPAMGWSGDIRLAARVDIRLGERFDADVLFERRDGDLHIASGEGMQLLGLTDMKLVLSAHEGVWLFNPVFKGRSLGEITGSVRVQTTPERSWPHAEAAISGEVQARVADIGIWGAWIPPGWRLAGELRTKATLSGRFADPRYTGEITGSGLSVRHLLEGVNVSDGQVAIRLEGDTATIDRFTLKGGDGTLALTGNATLGATPQAVLQVKAQRFRLLGRVDRMVIASGQAELLLNREKGQLDGRFTVDEGLFDASRGDAPSLDSDVTVRRPGDREIESEEKRPTGARSNFRVGLEVDLGQNLRVRGRGLDTGLRGSVRLSNPGGRLDVRGTINADEGTYAAYGQKLAIERGYINFGGPPDDPRLDVLALRPNIDTRVGVAITGTLLTPRVRLYSDPDMSDTEKLSWLVLGRAPDGLGRTDTALLQRAAVALLSGEGEAPTDTLLKNLGIDELSLSQSGQGDVRETVVTLGKQLSRRWYVGYERGVNSTAGTWQLIYRIAQRFTLRAQSGLENSLDVIWTWRFQETPADAAMRKSTITPPP
ncbi:MAG: translocation/assembly module TamB domain-containing protein, partial [Rubrivivax sp.]|nr:translocation/assembly module TamB domain-containing protein [Rubrivivax sp.]